jgi:hypothetical protein
MLRRNRRSCGARHSQAGFAMIAIVTMLSLVSSYFIASALGRMTSDVQIERNSRNLQTLQEARKSVIAFVAGQAFSIANSLSDGSGTLANLRLGYLPCPDQDDNGVSETTCSSASGRIGRLPWSTLNATDYRDGSGERLWYAISDNYRNASASKINVDTPGSLSVSGSFSASDIVAVIFAPGARLSAQTRAPGTTSWNTVSNYLESTNAALTDAYLAGSPKTRVPISGVSTYVTPYESDCQTIASCIAFNDQLVVITRDELFQAVEAAVPTLLQQLVTSGSLAVTGYFEYYRSIWGRYPFPAQFSDPTTSNYLGTYGQSYGLLPITSDASFLTWKNPSTAPTTSTITLTDTNVTTGNINPSPVNCSYTSATIIDCTITSWTNRPTVQVNNLYLNNAGQMFVGPLSSAEISLIDNTCNKSVTTFTVTHSLTPYASGSSYTYGSIVPRMRLPNMTSGTPCTGNTKLRITLPSHLAITSSTDSWLGWLTNNYWQRHLMYAIAPGWLPGGSGSCTAGTDCLTVSNLPSTLTATSNDKRVILTFSGRPLSAGGQSHPSPSLSNYFEQENVTPADYSFQNTMTGSTTTFNDRVVVVAP